MRTGTALRMMGLSPRVRGNRAAPMQVTHALRSIPASAGEPPGGAGSWKVPGVYPRECGGTTSCTAPNVSTTGLSPRVRGNLSEAVEARLRVRSIPASAGEPAQDVQGTGGRPVYPRECGGTAEARTRLGHIHGLSPRVRGNLFLAVDRLSRQRSIPASAGEPTLGCGARSPFGVYPRECGGTCPLSP